METVTYISHHGILGQKWGVRRYQNKDGTLTEAGKNRYTNDLKSVYQLADEMSGRLYNTYESLTNKLDYTTDPDYISKAEKILYDETQKIVSEVYKRTKNQQDRDIVNCVLSRTIDAAIYDAEGILAIDKSGNVMKIDDALNARRNGLESAYSKNSGVPVFVYSPNDLDSLYGHDSGTVDYYSWGHKMDQNLYDTIKKQSSEEKLSHSENSMETVTYIAHHGILGQKWGVRHYQNKDGTLTRAGQKRYADAKAFVNQVDRSSSGGQSQPTAKKPENKAKKISDMSTDELKAHVERLKAEKSAYELQRDVDKLLHPPKQPGAYEKFKEGLYNTLLTGAKQAAPDIIKGLVKATLGTSVSSNDGEKDKEKDKENKGNKGKKDEKSEYAKTAQLYKDKLAAKVAKQQYDDYVKHQNEKEHAELIKKTVEKAKELAGNLKD